MAIRLTGMASGLDTESMITDLMSAYNKTKHKKVSTATKYSWKMEAWSSLNKKINNLFSKSLSSMRFSDAYRAKKATVSDTTKATAVASANAIAGTQKLAIKQVAQSGYLTGGKLARTDKAEVTSTTKLSDLKGFTSFGSSSISVNGTTIEITDNTTIGDVVSGLSGAGLNANFDAKNGRIFVSSKESGKDGDFNFTAGSTGGINALACLGLLTDSTEAKDAYKSDAMMYDSASGALKGDATVAAALSALENSLKTSYEKKAIAAEDSLKANKFYDDIKDDLDNAPAKLDELEADIDAKIAAETDEDKKKELEADKEAIAAARVSLDNYNTNSAKAADSSAIAAEARGKLTAKAQAAYEAYNNGMSSYTAGTASETAVKQKGQDAIIYLNGAEFTSNKNTFDINGIAITVTDTTLNESGKAKLAAGEDITEADCGVVTLNTSTDTDAIYNTIKNFLKEYNGLIKEMDTLFNADSASKFDVLSDEEKDAMSDTEVEAWEKKIKDSLLRRDSDLDGLITALKTGMSATYNINGKDMSLATFGIETMSYFLSGDNEKGVYHIDGDSDDADTSANADKLRAAIVSDPEAVQSFFMKLAGNLYSDLQKRSGTTTMRSFGNFYNDKEMKSQYAKYQTAISDYETKLNRIEDKYYKQFSKMETALTKLQSSTSALGSLLGTN